MGASARIRVRKSARADGTNQVQLQVVLDREPIFIALKIHWPALLVDKAFLRALFDTLYFLTPFTGGL
jgi:hypothetical protein